MLIEGEQWIESVKILHIRRIYKLSPEDVGRILNPFRYSDCVHKVTEKASACRD